MAYQGGAGGTGTVGSFGTVGNGGSAGGVVAAAATEDTAAAAACAVASADAEADALADAAGGGRVAIPQMRTCSCRELQAPRDVTSLGHEGQIWASEIFPLATRAIPEQGRPSTQSLHSAGALVSRCRTCCVHASTETSSSMGSQLAARVHSAAGFGGSSSQATSEQAASNERSVIQGNWLRVRTVTAPSGW